MAACYNPLSNTLKPQSNGPSYSNTVIGTLAVDEWAHIVESCPLTKLNGGLSRLHSADEDAVSWLTNYGK